MNKPTWEELNEQAQRIREERRQRIQQDFQGVHIDRPEEGDLSRLKPKDTMPFWSTLSERMPSLPKFSWPSMPELSPINKKYALATVAAATLMVGGYVLRESITNLFTQEAVQTAEVQPEPTAQPEITPKKSLSVVALEELPEQPITLVENETIEPVVLEDFVQTPMEKVLEAINPVTSVQADLQPVSELPKTPETIFYADNTFNPADISALREEGYERIVLKYSINSGGLDAYFGKMGFSPEYKDIIMKDTTVRNGFVDLNGDGYGDKGIRAGKEYVAEFKILAPKIVVPKPEIVTPVEQVFDHFEFEGKVEAGQTPLKYFRDLGLSSDCARDAVRATGLANNFSVEMDVNGDGLFDYWQAGKTYKMVMTKNCGDKLGNFDLEFDLYDIY